MTNLTILSLALTLFPSSTTAQHNLFHRQQSPNATSNACQTVPNQNTYTTSEILSQCGNATLFNVWRPKARFIAPEGWMNDPMSLFTRSDGSFHVGYQSTSQHIRGGNMSQGAAHSTDFTTWYDFSGSEGYQTLYPSAIYDIRAVFDGSIINPGYQGFPTLFYTSTTFGPLGAVASEIEGVETQSMAWTEDDGQTWTKLNFGQGGNPVIYSWPEKNLTGFRDPYVFRSKYLSNLLIQNTNTTNTTTNTTTGTAFEDQWFSTLSGGQVDIGPHLWLYKQREEGDFVQWDWAGRFFEINGLRESWSEWSGNFGINFETAFVARLNESGYTNDDGSDETAIEIIGYGTERGREDHQLHWPLWAAVNYTTNQEGGFTANVLFAGVADWGASYAFVSVPYEKDGQSRHIMVGWTYEDEDEIVLAKQQGYQGALTLFRDLSIKYIRNVDPSAPGLYDKGSWGVKNETDGSITVYTLGQRVVQETVDAYREGSQVTRLGNLTLDSEGSTALEAQPNGRHYRLSADFTFEANTTRTFGMRVLASDAEYTDIVYDPAAEELTVNRDQTSIIKSFNNRTEVGKLRIWPIANQTFKTLSLSVYVDNSVIEIHANDEFALTTRAYPWYANSTGVSLLANGTAGSAVIAGNVELWDGLVNAWPERPENTSTGLVWDGPIAEIWGLYPGY